MSASLFPLSRRERYLSQQSRKGIIPQREVLEEIQRQRKNKAQ